MKDYGGDYPSFKNLPNLFKKIFYLSHSIVQLLHSKKLRQKIIPCISIGYFFDEASRHVIFCRNFGVYV